MIFTAIYTYEPSLILYFTLPHRLGSQLSERVAAADMAFVLPDAADADSPLKADELQVLRAQYEKEGYYVGVQTKFNYAWVRSQPALFKCAMLRNVTAGFDQIQFPQRTTRGCSAVIRHIPECA